MPEDESTWSSAIRDPAASNSQVFGYPEYGGYQKRSLAEELRAQREHKERMSVERMNVQYNHALDKMQTPL